MKEFSPADTDILKDIILHRRDVRGNRFLPKTITDEVLDDILFAGLNAPSVGFSQPWEFVIIRDSETKEAIKETFLEENEKGAQQFEGAKQESYNKLKLEGIVEAPVNIAVFYKQSDEPILGQTTMDQAGEYSVVCAIQNMWLMARALNVGLGWVSILDPEKVSRALKAKDNRKLVGYLCLGYVDFFYETPELEQLKWRERKKLDEVIISEHY